MLGQRLLAALILLFGCGVLISYLCVAHLLGPVGGSPSTEEVRVSSGMSAAEIGDLLEERRLVRSAFLFRLTSLLSRNSRSLKSGEYALTRNMTTFQIMSKIAAGETILYRFAVPEGLTVSQVAGLWEQHGFGAAADFIEASREPTMREKHGVDAESLEGYLFPETYMFPRGISAAEAIDEMLRQFAVKVLHLMKDCDKGTSLSLHDVISLASIIEKEAKIEEERPRISSVFHNRLSSGRKLESCVTVLYGLGYPRRGLTEADLRDARSPYNTYVYSGLPPGPICNPGLGSIAAALNPAESKYLYFVSKNDGTHYFAETYTEFLRAKRKYQDP